MKNKQEESVLKRDVESDSDVKSDSDVESDSYVESDSDVESVLKRGMEKYI